MTDRLFRLLLALYPARFRERYGEEMRTAWRAQVTHARERGRGAVVRAAARTVVGMTSGAVAEWRDERREPTGRRGTMERWTRDLGQAARRLVRAPLFSALAVTTLAVGTGAFGSVFAVVENVLLEPMPYDRPDELAWVWRDYTWVDFPRGWLGSQDVLQLAEQEGVEELIVTDNQRLTLAGPDGLSPRDVRMTLASPGFLGTLGVEPLLGRPFRPEDADAAAPAVVLLGHALWMESFGGDPAVVGRAVTLNGRTSEVVGVLPPDFEFLRHSSLGEPEPADLYAPFYADLAATDPGSGWLAALVRFRDGPRSASAAGALERVSARLSTEVMGNRPLRLWPAPLKEDLVGSVRAPLLAILAAAGFLVLTLAANLATLFLSRGALRERDLAVRAAVGASRGDVARSVVAEAALLTAAGGVGGVVLGTWGARALALVAADALPRAAQVSLDGSGVAATLALATLLGALTALAPTLRARGISPQGVLRESGRGGDSVRRVRSRDALVVLQVALSLVLLVGTGLLARSLGALVRVDPGFDAGSTLTFRVGLDGDRYGADEDRGAFQRRVTEGLAALPGVVAAGSSDALPLGLETNQGPAAFPDAPGNVGDEEVDRPLVDVFFASPGYVPAAGLRLLEGRDFTEGEGAPGRRVALVDDVLAKRFFPGGGAVGARIATLGDTATVVGVVDQPRFYDVRADDRGQVYLPNAWSPRYGLRFAVRVASGDPLDLAPSVRSVVARLDPSLAVSEVRTLASVVDGALRGERLNLGLVVTFAVAALLLAGLGIYGVVTNAVVRRRGEIGLRMALGARAAGVQAMVLGQGLRLVAFGLAAGLLGAWFASRFLGALLYGVDPRDPLTFLIVSLLLLSVGSLAAWLPARRATKVDPAVTLRAQ